MPADRDYEQCIELVEVVMEWIGMRWSVSKIKRGLREFFPGMSFMTCNRLIKAAGKEIRKRFNIDPQEYKGKQIEFYESIIRTTGEKTKNKLAAAERLDKLFGLESIQPDDPEATARRIREEIAAMEETVMGDSEDGEVENKNSDNDGEGQIDAADSTEGDGRKVDANTGEDLSTESDSISQELIDEVSEIAVEDLAKFRKKHEE